MHSEAGFSAQYSDRLASLQALSVDGKLSAHIHVSLKALSDRKVMGKLLLRP